MDNWQGIEFGDLINVLSLCVGLQNLDLNEQQVQNVMKELRENQNSMLKAIIKQNEIIIEQDKEIIKLLRGK